ncbi:unnamed protein product [Durusdinium trenchii]|uniref:Uncharacterized protein n=2 Tax=Durusdinium trenchii TaxID=1381693 RepID=A0ABP0JA91_9DINO
MATLSRPAAAWSPTSSAERRPRAVLQSQSLRGVDRSHPSLWTGSPLALLFSARLSARTVRPQRRTHCRAASEIESFREELRSKLSQSTPSAQGLLENAVASAIQSTEELVTATLEECLSAKALQQAARIYETWCMDSDHRCPLELTGQILEILAQYSNFRVATTEIQRLLDEAIIDVHEAAQLYDHVLRGLLNAQHPLTADRANLVIKEMLETQLQPTGDTLHLVVQAQTLYAAPGFLIDLGQTVLELLRRFQTELTSSAVLEISNAHLRSGDLDAAYRWFVASQLMPERPPLQEPHTLSLLSQLARALAIAGHALALKRLLQCVLEGDTTLPPETAAVALSGSTCGRTLCTCWLEPSAELLRRRSTWASDVQMKPLSVTVADQWDWKRQESSRHEKYQWYPYLAPDTTLERAWLTPLRSMDHGALGLQAQWGGQTPAQAAARERLGSDAEAFDLPSAVALEPPKPFGGDGRDASRPVVLLPEPRSFRCYHADVVKKAFPTSSRTNIKSTKQLKEALLAEKSTQIMMGTKPVTFAFRHSEIKEWLDGAEPGLIAHLAQQDLKSLGREELDELFQELSTIPMEKLKAMKLSKIKVFQALEVAADYAKGNAKVPLSDEEFHEAVQKMSEKDLQKAFELINPAASDLILGKELTTRLEAQLLAEQEEDEELDGSAEDELRLALENLRLLRKLGVAPSHADRRALLAAATALGEAPLAQEVLMEVTVEDVGLPEHRSVGPAGRALADAMRRGGWDRQSSEEFLKGERLFPRRSHGRLGDLKTRYVDPLFGGDFGNADAAVDALMKPYEGQLASFKGTRNIADPKVFFASTSPTTVQWDEACEATDEAEEQMKTVQVTKTDVFQAQSGFLRLTGETAASELELLELGEALLKHPDETESFLQWNRAMRKRSKTNGVKILEKMGLPVPRDLQKRTELLNLVRSVLETRMKATT